MSEQPHGEQPDADGPMSVADQDLPDDVRPEPDNPLAEPAPDDVPDDVIADTEPRSSQSAEDGDGGDGEG